MNEFNIFDEIINEMKMVYLHDKRPWMIGFSGGKDSTMLVMLVFEMLAKLKPHQITKKICGGDSDYERRKEYQEAICSVLSE